MRFGIPVLSACLLLPAGCSDETPGADTFGPVPVAGGAGQGDARTPVLVEHGGELAVVWSEDRGLGPDLHVRRFDQLGRAAGPHYQLTEKAGARHPAAAPIGDNLVLAWVSRPEGMMEVFVAALRPDPAGPLAGENISSSANFPSISPRLVSREGQALLAWTERGIFFTARTTLLDGEGRPVHDAEDTGNTSLSLRRVDLATDGRRIVLAANHLRDNRWKVSFWTLADTGRDPEEAELPEATDSRWAPAVALVGDGFVAAYRHNGGQVPAVELAREDPPGSGTWAILGGIQPGGFPDAPALAGDGERATVLWREEDDSGVHLMASPVGADGCFGPAVRLFGDVGRGEPVSAVRLDDRICAAWETLEDGLGTVHLGCAEAPRCLAEGGS